MSSKGIDVSHYQGPIDWTKVKAAGYEYTLIKAGEGVTIVDPMVAQNVQAAHAAGLKVGLYYFAWPNQDKAVDEANKFLGFLKQYPTEVRPVLDLEEPTDASAMTGSQLEQWTRDFLKVLTDAGYHPMVYTGDWFMDRFGITLSGIDLWISNYSHQPTHKYVAWQYASDGQVPGISGDVDMDVTDNITNILEGNTVTNVYTVKVQLNGTAVSDGVVYNGDTYVKWNELGKLGDGVQAVSITGGWNFVVTPKTVTVQAPPTVAPVDVQAIAKAVADELAKRIAQ